MAPNETKLIETLEKEMDFTPYEAKAYVALLIHGPLSPRGLNQKSGIPRPRTYDVLNGLLGKGLLVEQPGRPRLYAAVDPTIGLESLLKKYKKKMNRRIREKTKAANRLTSVLTDLYDESKGATREESVWVTRRDNALLSRYTNAMREIEEEMIVVSAAPTPPEEDILQAARDVLEADKTMRVLRPVTEQWSVEQLNEYEDLIARGDKIRHLDYDGLSFAVFDEKQVVLFIERRNTVWINMPELAEVLCSHFEDIWEKGVEAADRIREVKELLRS
ncbi:MAG: hypothetical protein GF309_12275 [Candidatus Lokiarchaeota archaeon]|nr:hypothetical protein [Candidatus Lokiarchaeota archaeon]